MAAARSRSRNSTTKKSADAAVQIQAPKYTDGESDDFEFGGSLGVTALMISFPLLMWYMWIGATYYNGKLPLPAADQTRGEFGRHLAHLVYEGAYPTAKAWTVFWTFFLAEAVMYVVEHSLSTLCFAATNILKGIATCPE